MTEVKSDEASLLTKRNLVDDTQEKIDDLNKKQKVDASSTDNLICEAEEKKGVNGEEQTSIHGANKGKEVAVYEEDDEDEDDEEEVYEDDDEDDDSDVDDGDSNGKAEMVDRKGKGIMVDPKGKGKMIEESEDSSEFGSDSDGDVDGCEDSDLSDDPLAEVDLDNILPTRTRSRSRVAQPGIRMSDSQGSKKEDGDN